jgi:K+-sensing histidine kinase KdpD
MASRFWRSAAQYFAGGIGLALVTVACVRFGEDIHVAAFGYLILIVLLALTSEFIGSVVLSIVAAVCLTYFFAPSLLSFRLDDPEGTATIAAFLTISFLVNGLIFQRK